MRQALVNGRVYCLDECETCCDAILIHGETIAAVGAAECIRALQPPPDVFIDLRGRAVLPGFIDTHVHLLEYGFSQAELSCEKAGSIAEVLELLETGLEGEPGPLEARALDPSRLKEARYPTPAELDAVSRHLPIIVKRRDYHSAVLNQAAWSHLGREGAPPPVLAGEEFEEAITEWNTRRTSGEREDAYRKGAEQALHAGVTTVHALVGNRADPANRDGELLLALSRDLPIDVVVYMQVLDVERVRDLGLKRIGGCLLLDGSIGSRTAALKEPYLGERENRGVLYFGDDELRGFVAAANSAELQTAFHAIGDRALEQIVDVHRACPGGDTLRHRLEHAELPEPSQMDRMRSLGLLVAVQPAFEHFWGGAGGMYWRHLGRRRGAATNPLRTLRQHGIVLAGGSDAPVTPLSPLLGIHAAVNHPQVDQRLSVREAIALFTGNAAYFSGEEKQKGRIEPGFQADLVVLGDDPFRVPQARLKDIAVMEVWRKGKRVLKVGEEGNQGRVFPFTA